MAAQILTINFVNTASRHSNMCLRSKDKNESLTIARLLAVPHAVSAAEHQLRVPRPDCLHHVRLLSGQHHKVGGVVGDLQYVDIQK